MSFYVLVNLIPFTDVFLETCYGYPRYICLFQLETSQTVSMCFPHYQGERGIAPGGTPIRKDRDSRRQNSN